MSDEIRACNEITGAVVGQIVQAGSIGHVIMHSPPTQTAPPAAMFSMRGDIPGFVGRHDELRTLVDTVTAAVDGPVRGIAMYTVDGMAGVGKTAFSVHAAHHLADRFADGQIFLELYGHSPSHAPRDPADALACLLVATGMDRSALPHEVDDRARLWRDRIAGKKVLLVLDDAASHDQLRPLLPGTPECFVVITSRHRLPGLDGVRALPLDAMPPDQAASLLLALAHRDPISANAGSATAAEQGAVARLVALCGFLPLAIALAAGRLRSHLTWSAAHLADLLTQDPDRLAQLVAGDRSIRAAFTVSYQHLTPERQWTFTLLGVHPGPRIDAYAVAALVDCSLSQAHHHLEALHADHLIQEITPGRYQLHDLLRVYAGSLAATADPADTGAAMRRILDYYLHTATTAAAHIPDSSPSTLTITRRTPAQYPDLDTPVRARAWLDIELETLATCLEHASAHPDLVIALAATLHDYLRVSGAWDQAHRIHHTALAAAEGTRDQLGQATTLTNLGDACYLRGDLGPAQQLLEHALQLFIDLGNRRGQANTLNFLGYVYQMRGKWERAQQLFEHALQLFIDLGDRLGQAATLRDFGNACRHWGDFGRAQRLLEHALQLFIDLGNRRGQANTLNFLGYVYHQRRDLGRAQQVLEDALQLFTDLGNRSPRGRANVFRNLGCVHHGKGEYDRALALLTQAYAVHADIGDREGEVYALNAMGDLALDYPPAGDPRALFSQAHILAHTIGAPRSEARALAGLGRSAHRAHDLPTATAAFTQALTIYQRLGDAEAATVTRYLADLRHDIDQHPEKR